MAIAWDRATPEDDLSSEAADSLTNAGQMLDGGTAGPGESMTAEGSEPSVPLGSDEAAPHGPSQGTAHPDASRRSYRRTITGHGERSS